MEVLAPWVNQGLLVKHLNSIFKGEETYVNTKRHLNVRYLEGSFLELDAWLPNLAIAFEFQDDYHYITTWYSHLNKDKIQFRDTVKTSTVRQSETTLVLVPCWWDGKIESLAVTIHFHRPDLEVWCGDDVSFPPISINPPLGYFLSKEIPNVGELMLASFPEDNSFKIAELYFSWWLGEKYDGIRFCWNPEQQQLYTRSGRALNLSDSITVLLPTIFMDGELWFGRGLFSLTHMLLIGASDFVYWHTLRLVNFDVPSYNMHAKPFEERYSLLLSHISPTNPLLVIAKRVMCRGREHLSKTVQGIIDEGGEGVILRIIGSFYLPGRNSALVKLKTVFQDTEGIVVSINEHNSAVLKLANGRLISIPAHNIPISGLKPGDIVTFSYERHARKPDMVLNPTVVRIRTDVLWEDVVVNATKEARYLSEHSHMGGGSTLLKGEWTTKKLRLHMEHMARRRGLDPLLPETWLQIIPKFKHRTVAKRIKILQQLFPKLDFTNVLHFQGVDIESRRKFFENYAQKNMFDPHNPENWYSQPRKRIASFRGASGVISYHKGSVSQALLSVFPDIGLDKNRLWDRTQWEDPKNRRKFFEKYAKEHEFNPLMPESWNKQKLDTILSAKGISRVISYHRNSVTQALVDLFPEIQLRKLLFSHTSLLYESKWRGSMYWDRRSWLDVAAKRKFFEDYANKHGFDPLVANNWYSQTREKVLSTKGAFGVIHYHNKSIPEALQYMFPDVSFDQSKFFLLDLWQEKHRRREFFETYAKENNFNPLIPEEWYLQSREKISSKEGALSVASYHKRKSLTKALVDLFPEIHFEEGKIFSMVDRGHQRKFFENYALAHGFDPLNPYNWYPIRRNNILSAQGAFAIMSYHSQNIAQALLDLFPDLPWEPEKFLYLPILHKI
eukprot:Phypoly_transcript_02149.p1 GENE.Phypoly_transcript_02149~~Phypoly_transcript_02149.p1  ORF type:complete len:898 (+),score=87.49 Phypoly_transcript_02149:121-2814(+)